MDLLKPYIRTIGYNIAKIAGSQLGFRHSDKTKELLRKQQLGKSYEDKVGAEKAKEWIEKTRKSNTGKKRSSELCKKWTKENNGFWGKTHTEEIRKKISLAGKGRNPPNKGRIILQYDLSNNFIQEIELHDAQIILKIQKSNIVKCCVGERKTAGGFIWKYKEKKK